ncbi:WYL domain-containing protein [Kangiella profundi]|uniref:WYL domain-containing protein n=1 Tax=Kangiella profundi TaxID=1561924 RepID=A0A2K9B238_9GAMM|nr:WYL domain-containing protein [Kangiella profundi]AUD78978.1 WYL domain-containing protein [Kangiella profundi]GGF02518.1 hypothetical protein GCM10011356_15280 [Kangiella profundi]
MAVKELSQIERQLAILRRIPTEPQKVTVNDLIEYLESSHNMGNLSKRSIQRDMAMLERVFGVHVRTVGRENYYYFPQGSHISLKKMGPDLALGFLLMEKYTHSLLPEASLDALAPYFKEAKLALKNEKYKYADWEKRVAIYPKVYPLEPAKFNANHLLDIYKALLLNKQFKMNYTKKGGETKDYVVSAQGVVQQEQVSYLIATYEGQKAEGLIQFAIHRINDIEILDSSPKRVAGFDIREYLEQGGLDISLYDEQSIELIFNKSTAQHLKETPLAKDQSLTELKDGRVRVNATINITQSIKWWLLGFGDQVEVIKPKAFRNDMKMTVQGMMELYSQKSK